MSKYEVMYIIRSTVETEARKALIEEINVILTSRGTESVTVNEWGMKEFAYEIDDMRKGYYVVLTANANADAIHELDRVLGLKEVIVRHLIINRDEK
jgi:small subunit ribosomal protein S6